MPISYDQIAAATSANDEATDFGGNPQSIVRELGAEPEAVTRAAQQRALKALSMVMHGDPDRIRTRQDMRVLPPTAVTLMAALAGSFMDGFAAALRITGEDARDVGEASAQAAFWRKRAIDLGADPEGYLKAFPDKP